MKWPVTYPQMRVSSYLIVALLVAALGGLALGALFIERQRLFDADNQALSLRVEQQHALERFSDHTRQLLISIDLLFGSEETYMLEPGSAQLEAALKLRSMVEESLGDEDESEKRQLIAVQGHLNALTTEVANIRTQTRRAVLQVSSEQLLRVDNVAQMLVESLTLLERQFSENLNQQRGYVAGSRWRSDLLVPMALVGYLLSVLAVFWWCSRAVSQPVSRLSHTARQALEDNSKFSITPTGPKEVRALTDHIGQFVASLQDKIAHNNALIEAIPDTILIFDRYAGVKSLNFAAGFPQAILRKGFSWDDFQKALGDSQSVLVKKRMLACLDERTPQMFDIALGEKGDEKHYEARTISINTNELVMIIRDLTSERRAESRIRHMAFHDGLTGLLNRRAFKENLSQHLAVENVPATALLFIDVDRFKTINDTHGHDAGDAVLQHVSHCFAKFLRSEDSRVTMGSGNSQITARLGGDEFIVLLPNVGDEETARTISRRLLGAISTPIEHADIRLSVTASIGVALYPNHGETGEVLLNHADLAMYKAKREGGNTVCLYESAMGESNKRKISMEAKLQAAIENEDLFLLYQPKVELASNCIVGVEALVRWRDGETIVPPDEFVPLAEKTGLILGLGDFVMRTAIAQMAQWRRDGYSLNHVAINVSAAQLKQEDFCSSILSAASLAGLEPSGVNVEITESMLMGQYSSAIKVLEELSSKGVTIAMDDFGTGYSSLSYLKDLPLDVLKIDRAFISGVNQSAIEKSIVTAIVQLGQTLGLRVVAEGVETTEQVDYLAEIGCDELQGYLFSPPVSADELTQLLKRQNRHGLRLVNR